METKFVFDRVRKEEEGLIEEILALTRKKAYPDANTDTLASFIHAMFLVSQKSKPLIIEKEVIREVPKMEPARLLTRPLPKPPAYVFQEIPRPGEPQIPPAPNLTPLPTEPEAHETLLPPSPTVAPSPKEMANKQYSVSTFNMLVPASLEKNETGKFIYKLNEPMVNFEALRLIKEYIADDFQKDFKILDNQEYVSKKLEKVCKKSKVEYSEELLKSIVYYLKRDLLGFRRIDPLMYDENVTAIYCDGLNKPVTVDYKNSTEKIETNVIFSEIKDLNALLTKLAKATGNELSETKPILDTVFQGYKIQAVLGIGGASSKLIIKKES